MWYEAQFAAQKEEMKKAEKKKDKKKPIFDPIDLPTKPALKQYITGDGNHCSDLELLSFWLILNANRVNVIIKW